MVNFTIQDVLIAVSDDYATVDVQVVDGKIAAMSTTGYAYAPNLQVIGTAIDGKNKLLLPGFFNAHIHSSEMEKLEFVLLSPP